MDKKKKKKIFLNMDPMYKMKGKFQLLFILQKNYFVFVKRFFHMIQDMIKQNQTEIKGKLKLGLEYELQKKYERSNKKIKINYSFLQISKGQSAK